jgi:hypothetical protein
MRMMNDNDGVVIPFKANRLIVTPEVTPPDHNAADPGIVKLLEDYLRADKEGKISFVAIASVDSNGVAFSTGEPENRGTPQLTTQALGAVSFLNFRFNGLCNAGAADDTTLRTD